MLVLCVLGTTRVQQRANSSVVVHSCFVLGSSISMPDDRILQPARAATSTWKQLLHLGLNATYGYFGALSLSRKEHVSTFEE